MEDIKDTTFVNLVMSIGDIQRKLATPKKRGVRVNVEDEAKLDVTLRNDMVSIITSPLSQMWKPEPIPGLSAAQVEALRALYASVSDESNLDEDLEAALETAVKLLNLSFIPRIKEETAADQNGNSDSTSGMSSGQRRIYTISITNISRRAIYAGAQKHTISYATGDLV
jgi:hypothetical protein